MYLLIVLYGVGIEKFGNILLKLHKIVNNKEKEKYNEENKGKS